MKNVTDMVAISPGKAYTLYMEPIKNQKEVKRSAARRHWHPAFFEAIQLELNEYRHALNFIYEHHLTTEPLKIDVVIIKKTADIPIKKNIAAIFRKINIFEYKSPDISVTVKDFYHVYGYACLYQSLNEDVDINEITLTFVESRYPRELIKHLTKKRHFTIEETSSGIYSVKGDILPIQIIDSRQLSAEENIWLKELDNRLSAPQLHRILEEIGRFGKAVQTKAYLDIIMRANRKNLQEALQMSRTALPTLDEVLEGVGLTALWEARGKAEGKAEGKEEIAQNMLKSGFPVEQVAALSGLDVEKINNLALKDE